MALEVNGARVDPEIIRAEAAILRQQARSAGREVTPEDGLRFWEHAVERTVEKTILEQEAARQSLAVGQLLDAWCKFVRPPRPKEVRDLYSNNREEFWTPASVVVSQIVKNVHHADEREARRIEMERVREILESGAEFAETADAHSDCPGNGGRIGCIQRGEMVPEFDDIVFGAPVGQVSPVFSTRFGFHIVLVTESWEEGILPFEKVAATIESALFAQKRKVVMARRIAQLRSQATIREVSGA